MTFQELFALLGEIWAYKLITISDVKLSVGNLTVALVMLSLATRVSRKVAYLINQKLISKFVFEKSIQVTYETFAFYGCLALFITLSLGVAGIPLTVFTVVGGALAIGVGFGSQNIVNNFISGVILLIEQPIKIGDVVEIDGITGTVSSVGTRSTQIKTAEGKVFVVPNSFFLEKSVLNWSYNDPIVRTTINFGVVYGSDVKKVENTCLDILLNTEGVLQEPMPVVLFENFNESSLDFQLLFWCDISQVSSISEVRSQVRFNIEQTFRLRGIEMPFARRDVNLKLDKALEVKLLS